jgi:hypothetical protein
MNFILYPDLTGFLIGFVVVAALAGLAALTTITVFFTQNHAVRVRRHESVRSYYGHLVSH